MSVNATITHVFLTSLGHSGSTILNIALGAVDGGLSLGEVEATVRQLSRKQHTCTCGAEVTDCPVWAPVFASSDVMGPAEGARPSLSAAYAQLYRTAAELSYPAPAEGGGRFLIDSSKRRYALASVPPNAAAQVKVILLVKDPRNYFVSHYRKWRRGRVSAGEPRKKRIARTFIGELFQALGGWVYGNHKILQEIKRQGYPYIVLSYEDMVLKTDVAERRLSEFLGVQVSLLQFQPDPAQQHILRGNALRHDPERSSRLVYDYRWFYDPWVRRLGFLFAPMISWGRRKGLLGELPRE